MVYGKNGRKWTPFKIEKYLLLAILRVLEGKIAVLRVLEGFFDKSEESRPPLKLKNNGGLLSDIFL